MATLSPAAAHRQRVLAQIASAGAPVGPVAGARPEDGPIATEYQLLLAQLGNDLAALKGIQSVEGKVALKAQLIEKYDEHVSATLEASVESGAALQDEIVATMMIWNFDIGAFPAGLDIAHHVLKFGLSMPQNIKRTPGTLIAEEIAAAASAALKIDKAFDLDIVNRAIDLTADQDMPDQVRAKLFKARGKLLTLAADQAKDNPSAAAGAEPAARSAALVALQRAFALDKNCGVSKDIERLEAKIRAAAQE